MWKKHPNHLILGTGMMMIGGWLIANNRFFSWPPDIVEFANDDIWGGLFIAVGLALIIWVIDGADSVKWNRRILSAAAFLIGFLTAYQFIIWLATGVYHSWISNAIITAFVLTMARRSDTRHE